ncbi:MAG: glycosyltransferase family 4 protein [Candidatus Omnitrophota bacterium]
MTPRLVTIHPFDPWGSKIGGIESAIRTMFQYAPADWPTALIGATENPDQRPLGAWRELDFHEKKLAFYPILKDLQPNQRRRIPLFLRFPLRLRREKFDLDNDVLIYHRIEPLAFASIPSSKKALIFHGDPDEITGPQSEVRWRHVPWLYRKMESLAVGRADKIFAVSRRGVETLQKRYPKRREDIIFQPVWLSGESFHPAEDKDKVLTQVAERYGLPPNKRFVLFAGRWEKQKHPLLALEAFSQLAETERAIHLLLAGEGSLQAEMEQRIRRLNLSGRAHLLGPLPPERLAEAMQASCALLMSSHFEGMPILALEALACGLPVVSTAAGEIPAIIENGRSGRIVRDFTPPALAEALRDVVSHPEPYRQKYCVQAASPYQPAAALAAFFAALRQWSKTT